MLSTQRAWIVELESTQNSWVPLSVWIVQLGNIKICRVRVAAQHARQASTIALPDSHSAPIVLLEQPASRVPRRARPVPVGTFLPPENLYVLRAV
jgi:hypothetical protein